MPTKLKFAQDWSKLLQVFVEFVAAFVTMVVEKIKFVLREFGWDIPVRQITTSPFANIGAVV